MSLAGGPAQPGGQGPLGNGSSNSHSVPVASAPGTTGSSGTSPATLSNSQIRSNAATSPSPAEGPSPLKIGTLFVKTYYHTLSTTPDDVGRLYQPSSTLSVGVGSAQATLPVALDALEGPLQSRFFVSDKELASNWTIRFEFENGAIDAQTSVDGGILLVVTGHIVYVPKEPESSSDEPETNDAVTSRRAFVHTFFLRSMVLVGGKKSFYVQNDILRFLEERPVPEVEVEEPVEAAAEIVTTDSAAVENDAREHAVEDAGATTVATGEIGKELGEDTTASLALNSEFSPAAAATAEVTADVAKEPIPEEEDEIIAEVEAIEENQVDDSAPGGGVEETKEPFVEDAETTEPAQLTTETYMDDKNVGLPPTITNNELTSAVEYEGGGVEETKDVLVDLEDDKLEDSAIPLTKPTPGSWASLVASSSKPSGSASAPSTPARSVGSVPKSPAPTTVSAAVAAPTAKPPTTAAPAGGPSAEAPATAGNANSTNASGNTNTGNKSDQNNRQSRKITRDPDCTLVIKNFPPEADETAILAIFEPFAAETGSKVVGCTVSVHRSIAFVDYNSTKPVFAALEKTKEQPIQMEGRPLEIYQKTLEQQKRRNQGGRGYRGGQPGNGRHQYRRSGSSNSGRGDRGGGRGGGRGGRS